MMLMMQKGGDCGYFVSTSIEMQSVTLTVSSYRKENYSMVLYDVA